MELGRQIRKYRMEAGLSQEQLADEIFVSRQTISNWENDRNYPDIRSLILLSEFFNISLDQLVKGDLEKMKKEIDRQEVMQFERDSKILTVLFILILLLPVPLVRFFRWYGMAVLLGLYAVTMVYAVRIEKYKRKFNIQTYKEIVAFSDGISLNEIESAREEGKRSYQKMLAAAGSAFLVVIIALLMNYLFKLFS